MFKSDSPVGIDDLSVYVPELFVSTTGEFAVKRGIEPAKLARGIGIERMAIPDAHEDAATMAAMSALELMRRSDLRPEQVGKIYVGTESAVDEAKAIGTYVIGMLEKVYGPGSFQECSTVEFKSACIGTTYALENMSYWLAQEEQDQVGLVVASDVARYDLCSSGEYTQGAGSVSLLVRHRPRLLAFEGIFGAFTRDENDFFRPIGERTAVVNGKHSNDCYLMAVDGAFASFERKARRGGLIDPGLGECPTDYVQHILFHLPYPRMAEYAAASLFRQEWRGLSRWRELEGEIGPEPRVEDYADGGDYARADFEFRKKFTRSELFMQAFRSKVEGSTSISRQVGNIYTGSIYLGLASLLESGKLSPGERACFGSYGSGCSALVFSALVQPGLGSVPSTGILERLAARREISLAEYEQLHEGRRKESIIPPREEFALLRVDEQGYRHYDFVR
ncbi:MAG: hydroxymethylglutaryl-CoA synthase family protein [Methanosarcinales archaeon]|nr:hydroxymethylglutaryl-CoA synthase family protein [Methanosarcinales archaeon]